MSRNSILSRFSWSLFAGTLGIALGFSSFALDQPAASELLIVKVFSDHFVADGARLSDLEALEASVKRTTVRAVRLEGCGPESTKPLLAAVARLHDVHVKELQIKSRSAIDPTCSGARELEYHATDRYGRSIMP